MASPLYFTSAVKQFSSTLPPLLRVNSRGRNMTNDSLVSTSHTSRATKRLPRWRASGGRRGGQRRGGGATEAGEVRSFFAVSVEGGIAAEARGGDHGREFEVGEGEGAAGVGRACGWVPRPQEDRRPVVPVGGSGRSPSSPSPPRTGAAPRLVEVCGSVSCGFWFLILG
ncbi:unnamed protein product [Musa acuminata subsp. malaccensis]|uniref:(wild Malaysian banana) hypothetical protein n=1 Tax=Musa acuminata subsp. malaccensis TaxID=214687 RepID=A0A804I5A9_MUSAM|nr:unnamed protein product [Musa acuminata subsp. malaccensis]